MHLANLALHLSLLGPSGADVVSASLLVSAWLLRIPSTVLAHLVATHATPSGLTAAKFLLTADFAFPQPDTPDGSFCREVYDKFDIAERCYVADVWWARDMTWSDFEAVARNTLHHHTASLFRCHMHELQARRRPLMRKLIRRIKFHRGTAIDWNIYHRGTIVDTILDYLLW